MMNPLVPPVEVRAVLGNTPALIQVKVPVPSVVVPPAVVLQLGVSGPEVPVAVTISTLPFRSTIRACREEYGLLFSQVGSGVSVGAPWFSHVTPPSPVSAPTGEAGHAGWVAAEFPVPVDETATSTNGVLLGSRTTRIS